MAGGIRILAVTPNSNLHARLTAELGDSDLSCAPDVEAALVAAQTGRPVDVVVAESGVSCGALADLRPHMPIVLLARSPESREAVAAVLGRRITEAVQIPWRPGELAGACRRSYQIGRLRREADERELQMHRRIESLATLNEIAAAMAEASSFPEVARAITEDLGRVFQFAVAAAMVSMDDSVPVLHLHCERSCDDTLLRATRDRCLELFRSTAAHSIDEDQLEVHIGGLPPSSSGWGYRPSNVIHEVISLAGRTVGILLVGAPDATQFSPDDQRFIHFLANRTADALHRLTLQHTDERRRLSMTVESMADGLILSDLHSDEVLINPAARKMLGIDTKQAVGRQFLQDALGFYPFDLISTSLESPGPLNEEVRIRDKVLHSMVSPVRDDGGKLVGVVVVLRDFTGEHELARRQQEFISVVSHELRTPLTSITGALDIALSEYAGKLNTKQRRYLKMARESCTRLNEIVDDLLDVAASESGRMSVHFTPLALDELGRETVDRYRPAAKAKDIRLNVVSQAETIRIIGDADRLTQVLNNLLSNAIKFTPDSGEIEVEIFGPAVAASHVGVSVFNNGVPIPPEARERIFDKFEQASESSTRQVGGTGLGLAISRAIVEAHGGRIWVESDARGTKFVFTLPAAPDGVDEEPREEEIDLSPSPQVEPGAIVLLVDDDQYSSYILKGILMTAGHEVLVANDEADALTLARSRRPALSVLSGALANGNAFALAEILKHDPDTHKSAVLVVSDRDQREESLRAGADEYLQKPVDPEQLKETCRRLISESGRARAFRILVVDDDPTIRTICREVLESSGYTVREASDGGAALAEAKRFRPDLMLVDIMMPGMDGFRTAEHFRGESSTAMTPVIFLSAKGGTPDKVRAFRIGAEDYIVKPFVAAEMVARVRKALDRRDRELGASPTTQLPGGNAIEDEIDRRLADNGNHAFCYLDLDNLKAFNDYYGYAKADGIIRQTGDLVRDVIKREGGARDFIGHIAGDDFVFITDANSVDAICTSICTAFDRLIPLYYNKLDRERGYIETKDRYGIDRKFPLMGVSLAAVTTGHGDIRSYSDLAAAAAAGKTLAKTITGSSYVRDGRIIEGDRVPKPDARGA